MPNSDYWSMDYNVSFSSNYERYNSKYWIKSCTDESNKEEMVKEEPKNQSLFKVNDILQDASSEETGIYYKVISIKWNYHCKSYLMDLDRIFSSKVDETTKTVFKRSGNMAIDQYECGYKILEKEKYRDLFAKHPYTKIFY